MNRRNLIYGGTAALAGLAGVGAAWWKFQPHQVDEKVVAPAPGAATGNATDAFWSLNFDTPDGKNLSMLAALEPRLLPALEALCGPLHCDIRPPRHIEVLVIDSSSFNRIAPDAYRLSFTLKNIGVAALEVPSLEVTLTDTQDQAVVRRVLAPKQFGAKASTLAAQSEMAGLVVMSSVSSGRMPLSQSEPL